VSEKARATNYRPVLTHHGCSVWLRASDCTTVWQFVSFFYSARAAELTQKSDVDSW